MARDEESVIGYKVLSRHPIDGLVSHMWDNHPHNISKKYKKGVWNHTSQIGKKHGYLLTFFLKEQQARSFADRFGGAQPVVFRVKASGLKFRLPPCLIPVSIPYEYSRYSDKHHGSEWPIGTVMAEKIYLLEEVTNV